MSASSNIFAPEADTSKPVTMFGPDFPYAFDDWIKHPSGLCSVPAHRQGQEVAIIGAGMAGMTAAFELMKMGLKPVIYEAARIGGRLRSQKFEGADDIVAELGGMRFPVSSTGFYHYVDQLGLESRPFPNPLSPATPSTPPSPARRTSWSRHTARVRAREGPAPGTGGTRGCRTPGPKRDADRRRAMAACEQAGASFAT